MIASPAQVTFKFQNPLLPEAKAVQITANSQRVTVAYFSYANVVIKAHDILLCDNPELSGIFEYLWIGDVWDPELVESVINLVNDDDRAPELAPLVPAYLQSLSEAS